MLQPTQVDTANACLGEGGSYSVRLHAAPKSADGTLGRVGLYAVSASIEDTERHLGLPDIPDPRRIVQMVQRLGEVSFGEVLVPMTGCVERLCERHGDGVAVREIAGRIVWGCLGASVVPIRTESVALDEANDDGIGPVTITGLEQQVSAVRLPTTPDEWFRAVQGDGMASGQTMIAIPTLVPGALAVLNSLTKPELGPDGTVRNTIERVVYARPYDDFSVSVPVER